MFLAMHSFQNHLHLPLSFFLKPRFLLPCVNSDSFYHLQEQLNQTVLEVLRKVLNNNVAKEGKGTLQSHVPQATKNSWTSDNSWPWHLFLSLFRQPSLLLTNKKNKQDISTCGIDKRLYMLPCYTQISAPSFFESPWFIQLYQKRINATPKKTGTSSNIFKYYVSLHLDLYSLLVWSLRSAAPASSLIFWATTSALSFARVVDSTTSEIRLRCLSVNLKFKIYAVIK